MEFCTCGGINPECRRCGGKGYYEFIDLSLPTVAYRSLEYKKAKTAKRKVLVVRCEFCKQSIKYQKLKGHLEGHRKVAQPVGRPADTGKARSKKKPVVRAPQSGKRARRLARQLALERKPVVRAPELFVAPLQVKDQPRLCETCSQSRGGRVLHVGSCPRKPIAARGSHVGPLKAP
jgi:hypothetical protein